MFDCWKDLLRSKHEGELTKARLVCAHHLLRKSMQAFKESLIQAAKRNEICMTSRLRGCFHKWLTAVHRTRLACTILQATMGQFPTTIQARSFYSWRATVDHRIHLDSRSAKRADTKLTSWLKKRYWRCWFGVYALRLTLQNEEIQKCHHLLAATFAAWHNEAYRSYREKAKELLYLLKENFPELQKDKGQPPTPPTHQNHGLIGQSTHFVDLRNFPLVATPQETLLGLGDDGMEIAPHLSDSQTSSPH